jgi:FtsP/CotA-like multicopper oxidase with cupredoxin domain
MNSAQRPKRRWARWTALGTAAVLLAAGGAFGVFYLQAQLDTAGEVDFATRMAIPPLAPSTTDADGTRTFDLGVQEGETRFLDGPATKTWGVNGSFLGPTIRAKNGEKVAFTVRNRVSEATSLHWHGMHVPADMDGGPHQTVEPGATWRPQWTISQQAATLWYHPHLHGKTANHVYRGVAGMFIIDDERTAGLNLPDEYGVDDLPLIVQDRAFDGGNQFDETAPLLSTGGVFGDEILVNGTRGPYVDVSTRLVRLRLLNASNARLYNFGFSDDRPFRLIGTDGGLLPKAWETTRLQLTPGERAEIVVAFAPGETADLRSYPSGSGFNDRLGGSADRLDVVRFRAAGDLRDGTEVPQDLGTAPDLASAEIAQTRSFELNSRTINGATMDMNRIDFGVRAGSTEVWEVVNTNGYMHNFHVHDVQFQVLGVDGEGPPPHLAGWKDTVRLESNRKYRLAMKFSDFTNPDVPYMFHCHLMLHEDEGMMGQFVVLREGEQVGHVSGHSHR